MAEIMIKNGKEKVVVETSEFQGKTYMGIRKWYLGKDGATWIPTKKGITLSKEDMQSVISSIMEMEGI